MLVALTLLLANVTGTIFAQAGDPWTAKELIEPDALVNMLGSSSAQKPVIYNIGPMANIKGAITIGSTANKAGLDKLAKALESVPKDKMVVIYCGCCPFRNCPNIRPAFNLLKEKGYTNIRLLNLKQNLKVNWIDNGYPMQ